MRQIILDTETTGLEPAEGHRIIEIGCVEMINRRLTGNNFHRYLQPDREIDTAAIEVHGITNEFLQDKPRFNDVAQEFLDFIRGAELIIHNAAFDVGFLNAEFQRVGAHVGTVADYCQVLDTLLMARKMHPGQRNSLDALCKRYEIDNSHRELHGALLDAEILGDVYLAMTGGQTNLILAGDDGDSNAVTGATIKRFGPDKPRLKVIRADDGELEAHEARLKYLQKSSGGNCLWLKEEAAPAS
ncbi:MAG TPA: DNA polymerase III subunit epsilon [Dongiaceae bacterium]|nr:DNA polymerase III subunit epsilon [Dongiaceae bacterium]